MVAGAFPLAKLGYLGLRQVSKPIASQLKEGAKRSYHWAETTVRMYVLGFGKPVAVKPLTEEMAVQLGADMLGEMIVFGIAVGVVFHEYVRSSAKARDKEEALYARIGNIERRLEDVSFQLEHQKTLTRELERMTSASLSARLAAVKDRLTGSKFSSDSHQDASSTSTKAENTKNVPEKPVLKRSKSESTLDKAMKHATESLRQPKNKHETKSAET